MNEIILNWKNLQEEKKKEDIINKLKSVLDDNTSLSNEQILELYNKSISVSQSDRCTSGKKFESEIEKMLDNERIPYKKQVAIDTNGIILGTGTKDPRVAHVLDIVVGDGFCIGANITDFIVISCKTTLRERWKQDEWTKTYPPKLYYLSTVSDDYPQPQNFGESTKRKIVTIQPKAKDKRIFAYDFDDMMLDIRDTYMSELLKPKWSMNTIESY